MGGLGWAGWRGLGRASVAGVGTGWSDRVIGWQLNGRVGLVVGERQGHFLLEQKVGVAESLAVAVEFFEVFGSDTRIVFAGTGFKTGMRSDRTTIKAALLTKMPTRRVIGERVAREFGSVGSGRALMLF